VWKVGREPTGLAFDGATRALFVWSQQSHTVTSMDMDAWHPSPAEPEETERVVALGPRVEVPDAVALGRELFHRTGDTHISSDGRACASCHPDGRDDGLVWATPDGPRQTPTLAGRLAGTAPYGWNGARSTLKQHVTGTVKRLGGTGLDDESMDALVAYCMHMDAPPRAADEHEAEASPASTLVAEGRELFESSSTGCASCHMADGTFTDGNRHDVKSKAKGDPHRRFDTPSLRFVSGTAPYFHDGRYPTLRALLVGSDGKMGHTAKLSSHDLDALEAYLKTL
jgi:cytochrome c peroxidase